MNGCDLRGIFAHRVTYSRPDTLDPALLRPGRLDRRVEFSLPDNEGRAHILRIHARRYDDHGRVLLACLLILVSAV